MAQKPSSLAAAGLGGGERAGGGGGLLARKLPPRAAAARDGADGDSATSSSKGHAFSDDDTENDLVHTSGGNMSTSNGSWGSMIGIIDGEGSPASDSSYVLSSARTSTSSDYSAGSSHLASSSSTSTGSDDTSYKLIVCCQGEDSEDSCMDRPIGMMLAKADPNDSEGDFICGKVRQKYEKVGDRPCEVSEVVLKDRSKAEYTPEEVSLYKQIYDANQGCRGCVEFYFKV